MAAVHQRAAELSSRSGGRGVGTSSAVDVVADALPPLGAAVEVAAYRVGLETMTDGVRHPGVTRCTVNGAGADPLTTIARRYSSEKAVRDDVSGIVTELPVSSRAEVVVTACDAGLRHD